MNKIISFDIDNTLVPGLIAIGSLLKSMTGLLGEIQQIDISAHTDRQSKLVAPDQLLSLSTSLVRYPLHNVYYMSRNLKEGLDVVLPKLAEVYGKKNLVLLTNRQEWMLRPVTSKTIVDLELHNTFQGGLFMRPRTFTSLDWKVNVLRQLALENPDKELIHIDNDLCLMTRIGNYLEEFSNVNLYLVNSLEVTRLFRYLAGVKSIPKNVSVLKNWDELLQ